MVLSLLPTNRKLRILSKSVISSLILLFAAVYAYFWKKRRDLINRIVNFSLTENRFYGADDIAHLKSRFATREKCNVVKTIPNFRDLCAADSADLLGERTRLRSRSGPTVGGPGSGTVGKMGSSNHHGCRLIKGIVYRSSNISSPNTTQDDLEFIKSKATKILDLRNINERIKEDNFVINAGGGPPGNSNTNSKSTTNLAKKIFGEKNFLSVALVPLQLLPTLADVLTQIRMAVLLAVHPSSRLLTKLGQQLIVQYSNLLSLRGLYILTLEYNKKLILKILKTITTTSNSEAIIIQCSCGKDATGLISALILAALDVSDDDIFYNYQMSVSLLYKDYCINKAKIFGGVTGLDTASFFQASPPGAIQSVWKFLNNQYGGVIAYFDDIGFDIGWRNKLKDKMLEKPKVGTA